MKRKGTLRARQDMESLAYRKLILHSAESDTVPVTLATEAPVQVYDKTRKEMMTEYLLMSGAELPAQVPLADSHNHRSVRSVLGSIRDLRVEGETVRGITHFGSKPASRELLADIKDGHITDASVGAQRLEETYVPRGQEKTVRGKVYRGPARIVTRWRPIEGSAVTFGADPNSTFSPAPAYRAYFDPESVRSEVMNETYRAMLTGLGMPEDLDDEGALEWAKENIQRKGTVVAPAAATPPPVTNRQAAEESIDYTKIAREQAIEAYRVQRQLEDDIRKTVRMGGLDDSFASTLIGEGLDLSGARDRVLKEVDSRRKPVGLIPGKSHAESLRSACLDGLSLRIGAQIEKPAPGANEFRGTRLLDIARRCLDDEGIDTRMLGQQDIARRAFMPGMTTRASDGQAYLTTGNFSNLLLDAANKMLLKSFEERTLTYQQWARQAESVKDFKNVHRIRLGEIGNQPTVPENDDYKDMSISDSREFYAVEKRGSLISLTFEAMVNDDLGGFTRVVQLQGAAMRRTINRSVYQILFDNPTLSDSIAIFHASSHGANLVTSDLSVAVLNTAYSAMMLQTGLNSDVILGIVPRYLVVAPGIAGTAWQLLNSTADPVAGGSTSTGNSNTANMYGPGGVRRLELIVEPILAGNDANSWYLIADSSDVDTIEYAFLQGEETPVLEQETAFIQDAVKYKIRQTWGVKAIDYRGMYKSTGSS